MIPERLCSRSCSAHKGKETKPCAPWLGEGDTHRLLSQEMPCCRSTGVSGKSGTTWDVGHSWSSDVCPGIEEFTHLARKGLVIVVPEAPAPLPKLQTLTCCHSLFIPQRPVLLRNKT